ncbi:MAG: hypothetical protein CBC42_06885 [Betaproteobacteria bacterium TMED82]|nr:MAG: hypothetical protein CBC42_06885 [Betaproteobacteria bacterium TMED82]|tara:strand:- start:10436 stop:10981 length:546 start_codon:yes stop_codon:yes gene_type:complete
MPTESPIKKENFHCPDFDLLDVTGTNFKLTNFLQSNDVKGFLVMFICNHCPYVKSILDRLVEDIRLLQVQHIPCIAISSNDALSYPEDSYENMQKLAKQKNFSFPYLYDESQTTARSFGAVCTPDFFGFDKDSILKYRGRFLNPSNPSQHELLTAMTKIGLGDSCPKEQFPSIGCSIKWKN